MGCEKLPAKDVRATSIVLAFVLCVGGKNVINKKREKNKKSKKLISAM
jgi:hypothetical protein